MDDLILITLFFIVVITILIISTTTTTTIIRSKVVGPNLPPGPRKLPIIGNLHHMIGHGAIFHHRLRDLARQYGPLMHLQLGEISTIVVTSSELAKEFMQTHDLNFATRPSIPSANIIFYDGKDMAFSPYGEYWKQMRKIFVRELLGPKRVDSFRMVIVEEARQLVRSIDNTTADHHAPLNLSRMLISLATAITYRTAFGKKSSGSQDGAANFFPVLDKIMVALGGFSLCDVFPSSKLLRVVSGAESRLRKLHNEADVILEAIINDHKERRRIRVKAAGSHHHNEDVVDVLLNFSEDHALGFPITNVEIKACILDIFLAGSETSSGMINWAMSELMKNPEAMKKAQTEVRRTFESTKSRVDDEPNLEDEELPYLKLVVKETLRLHPPPLLGPREARESMVIGGWQIPAKSRIVINGWAIGRDPNHWTEPERFYPERFLHSSIDYKGSNFELIPFGGGRRICSGMHFGVSVVNHTLANLLYHFDWRLPDGMKPEEVDLTEEFSLASKKKKDLFVIPVPYKLPISQYK